MKSRLIAEYVLPEIVATLTCLLDASHPYQILTMRISYDTNNGPPILLDTETPCFKTFFISHVNLLMHNITILYYQLESA